MLQSRPLRIGTRGSPLALAQAHEVRERLMAAHGLGEGDIDIQIISTSGDQIQDKALRTLGGKGLFTKEIQEAMLRGEIDAAVHSMKDVETKLPDGLEICCLLPREDVRDAFISFKAGSFAELPQGAVVGTSSLRRQAQVRQMRPDLKVVEFRGNVQTRLRKLEEGVADATLLACAGLNRLGLADKITKAIETDEMLPAVAQGAIGIEVRRDDGATKALFDPLNDKDTALCVGMERVFLAALDGSCRTPIAGLAELPGNGEITFRGVILSADGATSYATSREGGVDDAENMAKEAAEELLERAGPGFFEALA